MIVTALIGANSAAVASVHSAPTTQTTNAAIHAVYATLPPPLSTSNVQPSSESTAIGVQEKEQYLEKNWLGYAT